MATATFTVTLGVADDADPSEVADALVDYLCDGGDGDVPYPAQVRCVLAVQVQR